MGNQGNPDPGSDSSWKPLTPDSTAFRLQTRPGLTYELSLRYNFQPETVSSYTIFVGTRWWNTTWFRILSAFILVGGLITTFVSLREKKRTRQIQGREESRQQAVQSLRSVQAQLNPHFIFNALGSIQGLVNSGDMDAANEYLSAFSRLMRNALEGQEQMYNRLDAELASMETYLKLEQLRFHFQFSIEVGDDVKTDRVDIPGLLLQPVIENAVLHGVSALRGKGRIDMEVYKKGHDLLVSVSDNGPGFADEGPSSAPGNYGLKLTADRIRLLNQLQPSTIIELERRNHSGTTFIFSFKNWLA